MRIGIFVLINISYKLRYAVIVHDKLSNSNLKAISYFSLLFSQAIESAKSNIRGDYILRKLFLSNQLLAQ